MCLAFPRFRTFHAAHSIHFNHKCCACRIKRINQFVLYYNPPENQTLSLNSYAGSVICNSSSQSVCDKPRSTSVQSKCDQCHVATFPSSRLSPSLRCPLSFPCLLWICSSVPRTAHQLLRPSLDAIRSLHMDTTPGRGCMVYGWDTRREDCAIALLPPKQENMKPFGISH